MRAVSRLGLVSVVSFTLAACTGGTPSPSAVAPTSGPTPGPTAAPPTAATSAAPVSQREARAAVCEAAKAEGTVVHWNALSEPEKVHGEFTKLYPDITVESVNSRPTDLVQQALVEHAAGRTPGFDVTVGEPNVVPPLIAEDLLDLNVDWAALGIPDDLVHPDINSPRHSRDALGIVFNTDTHSAGELPNAWSELADPKWQNLIVVDPRGRPFDQLSLAYGHDETLELVRDINGLKPLVIQGATAGMLAVAGGQAAIATGGRSAETDEQKSLGAPLDIKYLDVLPVNDSYSPINANAPHPNAALCFAAWFASEDGQAAYFAAEFKSNAAIPKGAPEGIEILSIETEEQGLAVEEIAGEIAEIWTGTGG
jgi:ABC-type Fe3+ transport system substrate-binding protein